MSMRHNCKRMNPCGHITCIECSFEWTASLNGRPPTCLTCRVVLKSAPIRVYAFQFLHDQVTGHGPHGETWVPRITYGRNVSPAVRRRELYGGPMPVVVQGAAGAGANTARRGAGGEGPDAVVEGLRRLAQERVLRELGGGQMWSFQEFLPSAAADDAADSEYVPTEDEAEEEDDDAASQRATAGDPVNEDFLPYYALQAAYPPRGVIGVGGAVRAQHFEPLAPPAGRPVPLLEQLDALTAQAHAALQRDYSSLPPPLERPRTPINAEAPQVPLLEQIDALTAQAHAALQRDYSALPPPLERPRTPINAEAPQ
ncbi:hypothetical protein AURDEDRAFT_166261, partial [Auricularia subglabra TFB-10046 SS5]